MAFCLGLVWSSLHAAMYFQPHWFVEPDPKFGNFVVVWSGLCAWFAFGLPAVIIGFCVAVEAMESVAWRSTWRWLALVGMMLGLSGPMHMVIAVILPPF